MEPGHSALTRRERLERIATAERDRRAGRIEVAVAAIGEPSEWPARVVLALALLSPAVGEETDRARRLLEAGLDLWASELGLASLDPTAAREASERADGVDQAGSAGDVGQLDEVEHEEIELLQTVGEPGELPVSGLTAAIDRQVDSSVEEAAELAAFEPPPPSQALSEPIEVDELERAFAQAEAQTDEMHDVNRVAERVLMDEAVGLAELSGDMLLPAEEERGAFEAVAPPELEPLDAAVVEDDAPATTMTEVIAEQTGRPASALVLATLTTWLENLERRKAGRAQ